MLINGKSYWFRAQGAPHTNKFNPDVPQWSFDLSISDEEVQKLLDAGMTKTYLRNKDDERGTFLSFVRDSVKKDGTPAKPFRIEDAKNNPWPEDKSVGNGSELNVVVSLNERAFRGQKFSKPSAIAIQVWDHVAYQSGGFPTKDIDQPAVAGTW
jgi:hypothetical protein